MSVLRERCLFVAIAALTTWAFIQSPSAQISGSTGGDLVPPPPVGTRIPKQMGVPATAAAAAADKKAAAAMTTLPSPMLTDADRKATEAMSR